jgi:Ca2+/Na+ antiporter
MSDATIIVQHLASVVIFCCCFVAIIHGRVSPVAVVGWASLCTLLAWALWDYWKGHELVSPSATTDVNLTGKDGSKKAKPSRNTQQRLTTAKSAVLIYAALLGLSPILKSLTRSTTSDSIWALSTWLLLINVAFFDYSGGPGTQ